MRDKVRLIFSVSCGMAIVIYILFVSPYRERLEAVYSTDKLSAEKLKKISFSDVTEEWGVVYNHQSNFSRFNSYLSTIHPSVLIYDFNEDGFVDIFYSGGARNYLYINNQQGKFKEAAEEYGLVSNDWPSNLNSMALMADFNRDGKDDLYLAATPTHRLYLRKENKFEDASIRLNNYKSFPDGANLLDFNQDGLLDIVVGNIIELDDEPNNVWYIPRRYDEQTGGYNHLLIQQPNGEFIPEYKIDFQTRSFTHAVGISDINRDSFPDIFFANDYSMDQMFLNNGGKTVSEVTEQWIPRRWHGNSGMNAEFADFNRDGLNDLYVTNIHKPPFYRAFNLLWMKKKDSSGFEQVSWDENIGKCGFSWAGKFADFNLDGQLDMFVVNGRDKDPALKSPEEGQSFWYERTQLTSVPKFFLGFMKKYERDPSKRYYNSAFERDCLFIQDQGKFFDVANDIGLTDAQEGRALAIADFNNDGKADIVVGNVGGNSKVYLNRSQTIHNWVGVKLHNINGSQIPIGALLNFYQTKGPVLFREYYPGNGYRGQSDNRLIFTLDKDSLPEKLEIIFPGKRNKQVFKDLRINTYNEIREQ